ncbi:MAG: cobalamin biosynthesis protein CobD [Schwartzia sp.]|nr:cobalamin biosynthesis protein CobD [Schwartzia sp. (in: firmicutes)]
MSTAIAAFLIDCLIGDPRSGLHPVVLIGKWIALLEKWLYRPEDSDRRKFLSGLLLMVIVLATAYEVTETILFLALFSGNSYVIIAVSALLLSFTIAPRNLAEAGLEIRRYLLSGDLGQARFKVGWIVGRDTDKLTVGEVTRATVETISENIVDGVISPLFFFYLGGVPLAMAYRAANTMDSMIGYKNDKYLYFGRAAALADDAWNYIPARLTGLLLVIAAFLLRMDWRAAWRMMWRDAKKHPSPNGGYTEATVAGALGIRLGGLNYYFGQPSFRTCMGDAVHELEPEHISQSIWLMYTVTVLFLCLASAICWRLGGGIP